MRRQASLKTPLLAALTALMAVMVSLSGADTLKRKSGPPLVGSITWETDDRLQFALSGGKLTVTVLKSDIVEIVRASGEPIEDPAGAVDDWLPQLDKLRMKAESDVVMREGLVKSLQALDAKLHRGLPEGTTQLQELRGELEAEGSQYAPESQQGALARRRLAHVLMALAEDADNHVQPQEAEKLREQALQLAPDIDQLAPHLAMRLLSDPSAQNRARVRVFLDPYLRLYGQQDTSAVSMFVAAAGEKDPWRCLALAFPHGVLRPGLSSGALALLPTVLLKCFNSDSVPAGASLTRRGIYEQYLALVPTADPGPLVALQLAEGESAGQPLTRYAEWAWKNERVPVSLLTLQAASFLTTDTTQAKVEQTSRKLSSLWRTSLVASLRNQVRAGDYQGAHDAAIEYLFFQPTDREVEKYVTKLTSVREACPVCRGTGAGPCVSCSGRGTTGTFTESTCNSCQGKGLKYSEPKVEIPESQNGVTFGAGAYGNILPHGNVGSGLYYADDAPSKGAGFETMVDGPAGWQLCRSCGGSGVVKRQEEHACQACGGSGVTKCSSCAGAGWFALEVPREPSFLVRPTTQVPDWLVQATADTTLRQRMGALNHASATGSRLRVDIADYPTRGAPRDVTYPAQLPESTRPPSALRSPPRRPRR